MATVQPSSRHYRIGVDVGGTNTDGVIIDITQASSPEKAIIAWHKSPTTPNPSDGISNAITTMLRESAIEVDDVKSVTIGTTHFINAVVERDATRLSKVAVIRLSGSYSKFALPCVDWPDELRELILWHHCLIKGGLQIDGSLISDINESEVREQCRLIRDKGIRSIVVNGIFSPIDTVHLQEERVADIVKAEIPGCHIVCSKEIANLGFIERENAAILNASILPFARRTIRLFQNPIKQLGLQCPVFLTQNDGTILSSDLAAKFPIKTFSSGPTNSMRGAAFLAQGKLSEAVMVVDIGGTTSDVGLLQSNGFPRQQAAYSDLAGVRMNFPCPDIKSIGLGGGSIVQVAGNTVSVGPTSVGYKLQQDAVVFGGKILTATDLTVLSNPTLNIGEASLVLETVDTNQLQAFKAVVKAKLEKAIDAMKTSPEDIPVLLVGGGAVIAPDELKGASKVIKPKWSEVANAIGAAMARVSAVIDVVKHTESRTIAELEEEISKDAIEKAVAAGALRDSVEIVEIETLPLQYIDHKSRFVVRAAGNFDFSNHTTTAPTENDNQDFEEFDEPNIENGAEKQVQSIAKPTKQDIDISSYRPNVKNRTWYISETDLTWISIGCYILGTGGGGSPYADMIRLRTDLRNGAIVRVVSLKDLKDSDYVGTAGGVGSPTVGIERLPGDELVEAQRELARVFHREITHIMPIEIGGGNGLQGMILGSSSNINMPSLDADFMSRAYPTSWQTTPVVFNERSPIWCPVAMADGNGNVLTLTKASSDESVERILRAALVEMGSSTACAEAPASGEEAKRWAVENTVSQAWRIGRAVVRARQENRVDNVAEAIIDECGGHQAGRVIWKGKIVSVERMLRGGYVYGECIIEGMDVRVDAEAADSPSAFRGRLKIPFKNENIAALRVRDDGKEEQQEDVVAIVPDLITVIDAQNGEAIGTPEYRYGLLVVVLGLAVTDKWTSTERGIELGGPKAFGFDHLKYEPLGEFVKPKSVIDEYDE